MLYMSRSVGLDDYGVEEVIAGDRERAVYYARPMRDKMEKELDVIFQHRPG